MKTIALIVTTAIAFAGCAGDARPVIRRIDAGGALEVDTSTPDLESAVDQGLPASDVTLTNDTEAGVHDRGLVAVPDARVSGPGGSCPCQANSACIGGVCRATCRQPSDTCRAVSTCDPGQACAPTVAPGVWVCVPGVATGRPCDSQHVCAQDNACAIVGNDGTARCIATCPIEGIACGTGGTCVNAGAGCFLCLE